MPEEPKQRWYTVQVVDMYTHNIGNVGTRHTGNAAGHHLIAGPRWNGYNQIRDYWPQLADETASGPRRP